MKGPMENHRDEHIVCADCSASFLFSAGEATVFQERGLAAPKRCKDCRRARKDRASSEGGRPPRHHAGGGFQNGSRDAGPPRGPRPDGGPRARGGFQSGPPRNGPPRYTGDVNEYRSPMQDGNAWQPPQWQGARGAGNAWQPQAPRAPRRGGPGVYRHDGDYRAPSGNADGFARNDRPRRASGGASPAQRQRPQAEMFSITCNSCGGAAEVPFKPAEGRDVFCQTCYRARKPQV